MHWNHEDVNWRSMLSENIFESLLRNIEVTEHCKFVRQSTDTI